VHNYAVLEAQIPYLEKIDELSNSGITIFDLHRKKHAFVSRNVSIITGTAGGGETELTNDHHIHPEDISQLFESGTYFLRYGMLMPPELRKNFKLVSEFRMMNAENRYIRVIEQQLCFENDIHGNIWLAMGILDISPDQDQESPFRSRLIDLKNSDIDLFPPPDKEAMLTARQKDILKLISKGLISKEIADRLFISVNTVNTHRQNILEKLQVNNAYEAVRYVKNMGMI